MWLWLQKSVITVLAKKCVEDDVIVRNALLFVKLVTPHLTEKIAWKKPWKLFWTNCQTQIKKGKKMADIVNVISKATNSFLNINTITVDNWTFKLFYKWTVTLLVACSVLVASKQFFGGPITCDAGMVRYLVYASHDFA